HPVHVAPILQPLRPKHPRAVEADLIQYRGVPVPLILQVVNGVDDAPAPSTQQEGMARAQKRGTGSRLPVVEVEDVGSESQHRQRFQQPAAEEDKAALLVAQVETEIEAAMHTEELFVLHQVDLHGRFWKRRTPPAYLKIRAAERHPVND